MPSCSNHIEPYSNSTNSTNLYSQYGGSRTKRRTKRRSNRRSNRKRTNRRRTNRRRTNRRSNRRRGKKVDESTYSLPSFTLQSAFAAPTNISLKST